MQLCLSRPATFDVCTGLFSVMGVSVFVSVILSTVSIAPVGNTRHGKDGGCFRGVVVFGISIPAYDVARSCRRLDASDDITDNILAICVGCCSVSSCWAFSCCFFVHCYLLWLCRSVQCGSLDLR